MRDVSGRDRGGGLFPSAENAHKFGVEGGDGRRGLGEVSVCLFPSELANYDLFQGCRICSIVHTNRGLRDTKSIHEAPLSLREGKNLKAMKNPTGI